MEEAMEWEEGRTYHMGDGSTWFCILCGQRCTSPSTWAQQQSPRWWGWSIPSATRLIVHARKEITLVYCSVIVRHYPSANEQVERNLLWEARWWPLSIVSWSNQGAWVDFMPVTKNVAVTFFSFNKLNKPSVTPGSGPSSKVRPQSFFPGQSTTSSGA